MINKVSIILGVYLTLLSCKVNPVFVNYYEEKYSEKSIKKKDEIDLYIKMFPIEYRADTLRKRGRKLLIFQGESFKGQKVIINNDTLTFRPINEQCIGSRAYIINSKRKEIKINSYGDKNRGSFILKLKKEYDYIEISGGRNWDVTYSDYFIVRECL